MYLTRCSTRIIILFTFLFPTGIFSQECKNATAIRTHVSPKIDGVLDDSVWINVPIAADFKQMRPNPGEPSRRKTEVRILYDDDAVYVGAMMFDDKPDSILKQMG